MRNFILFILCFIAVPAWAAPSLTDLDSWQLPEVEPLPVAPVQPVSEPKPVAPKKTKAKKGKELKVQLTENNAYAVASSTQDATEIDIMNLTAQQLMSKYAGKGRFHILFNANMPADIDTEIVADDGIDYAMAVFGNGTKKYRILLFKGGLEQPLIAVSDNLRSKLNMMQKYRIELDVTEDEMKRSYPSVTPQEIIGKEDEKTYHAYQLEGPLFVVFQSGKFIRQFNNEQDFTLYANDLQEMSPDQQTNSPDSRRHPDLNPNVPYSNFPGNPGDPHLNERPGFPDHYEDWNLATSGGEHKRLFSQIVKNYYPRARSVKSTSKKKTDGNSSKSAKGKKTSSKRNSASKTNTRNSKRR